MKFITDDGQEFFDYDEAMEHEENLKEQDRQEKLSNIVFYDANFQTIEDFDLGGCCLILTKDKNNFTKEELSALITEFNIQGYDYYLEYLSTQNNVIYYSTLGTKHFKGANLETLINEGKKQLDKILERTRTKEGSAEINMKTIDELVDFLFGILPE